MQTKHKVKFCENYRKSPLVFPFPRIDNVTPMKNTENIELAFEGKQISYKCTTYCEIRGGPPRCYRARGAKRNIAMHGAPPEGDEEWVSGGTNRSLISSTLSRFVIASDVWYIYVGRIVALKFRAVVLIGQKLYPQNPWRESDRFMVSA